MIEERINVKGTVGLDTVKIYPITQEKIVVPTKEIQEILPDEKYDALSKVMVKPIPDEYVDTNDYYNLEPDKTSFSVVNCITQIPYIDTSNVTVMSDAFANMSSLKQIPKINTSKVYQFATMFNGCSSLTTIPQLDTSKARQMNRMFYNCSSLQTIPQLDTSNVIDTYEMFNSCSSLTIIPQLDTSNVTDMHSMFSKCSSLITVPQLNAKSVTACHDIFILCSKIQNLGGLLNLGQAYSTSQSANYYYYQLNLSYGTKLTHDSLMNVINGLYDIKAKGCNSQRLIIGNTNLAKLTSEEISICTSKGWTVS